MDEMLDRVPRRRGGPGVPVCGGILKSATISFGENLVPEDLMRAQSAAEGADLFLTAGTSLGVYPAAALPEITLASVARLVVLNGEPTPFDDLAGVVCRDRLGEVLPEVVARI